MADGGNQPDAGGTGLGEDANTLAGAEAERLRKEAPFWEAVAICGEAAESYPTVAETAQHSDAVVVGHVAAVSPGRTVQGDAPEDFYAEANLRIEVDEVLKPDIADQFDMSLVLPRAITQAKFESAIETMRKAFPKGPIVLLVRARRDIDDLYVAVSDRALWTETTRSVLDHPITHDECLDPSEDEARRRFLGPNVRNVDDLIEMLRE